MLHVSWIIVHATASMNMWLHLLPTRNACASGPPITLKRVESTVNALVKVNISSLHMCIPARYFWLTYAWVRTHALSAMPSASLCQTSNILNTLVVLKVKYICRLALLAQLHNSDDAACLMNNYTCRRIYEYVTSSPPNTQSVRIRASYTQRVESTVNALVEVNISSPHACIATRYFWLTCVWVRTHALYAMPSASLRRTSNILNIGRTKS